MASNSILPTFPVFSDVDGNPLESGYIYIGDPGFNPEVAPKATYWDASLTVPVAQPVRTIGGYPSRSGAPAMMYTDGDYSITVRNKNETLIYSSLNSTFEIDSDALAPTISKVSRALYVENTSGVADTLTLVRPDTTIDEVTAYYDGLTLLFDNSLSNTGAVTATLDGLASKKVRTAADADLVAGAIVAGVSYFMVYNTSLDSGSGAFELKDMQPQDTFAKLWDPQTTTHNFTTDADYTLTSAQNLYGRIVLTDTGVVLTTARNVITDNVEKSFTVQNDTAQTITVKTLAGTGIAILSGEFATLYNDGVNIITLEQSQTSHLLTEFEVTGAAVTSIDFSGLDISVHKSYSIEMELTNATGSAADIYLFVNNDTTLTNYYTQIAQAAATTQTDARVNTTRISGMAASAKTSSHAHVSLVDSEFNATSRSTEGTPSVIIDVCRSIKKIATVANVTQLTFTSSVASAIGIGSKIRIYRGDA